jgi:hypothetical protein
MAGKAGDNAGVKGVYYALNGSGWELAVTGNGWTNWTAGLALAPGTNTVQAYAVDLSGNISATNLIRTCFLGVNQNTNVNRVVSPLAAAILASPVYTKSGYAFEVTGVPGDKYAVEASTDLVNWDRIQTNTAPFIFEDPDAGRYSQRFYRSVGVP